MQYRTFGKTGESVSILGYGCMRYPQKSGRIDEARTEAQIRSAIAGGINYFDTAYIYHGGRSETILGNILSKGLRDKVLIADKIPPYLVSNRAGMDRILDTQLERLKTDRIDFYLVHALSSYEGWKSFRSLGFDDFVRDAKAAGKIRHVGFSWHGPVNDFKRVVEDWDWSFTQIQYNYLDENYQAGREGLRFAQERGLGVAIMEPLRGGLLSGRMPDEARKVMEQADGDRSAAAWAFGWIWDQPEPSLLLSGLNEEAHIAENLRLAAAAHPGAFSEAEHQVLDRVREVFSRRMHVNCTGCGYCMPCPFGVDIPGVFADWNAFGLFGMQRLRFSHVFMTGGLTGAPSHAGLCRDCGKCEKHCPQHISIRARLKEARKALDVPVLRPMLGLAGKWMRRKRKPSADA